MFLKKLLTVLLASSLLPASFSGQVDASRAATSQVRITKAVPETAAEYAERKRALQEMLQRLTTTGRIMQVVAHPDDEDGAMLTLESRVKGNTAELFTFTRGEGGQNAQGAVFFDELGILRTLELLAADKEYGAEERFSHVADFGFSKSPQETFAKWGGEEVPLEDLVRAVREFQPDVLVARFSGTAKDGHGHHQASALMTMKAFADAADPKRFPSIGSPWKTSKLYTGLAGDQATLVPDETDPSALLDGKTPQEVAIAGLRHQESQGAGNWKGPLPKVYSSYKIVETANGVAKAGHENDFFQGIDTSLPGMAARFDRPQMYDQLNRAQDAIREAGEAAQKSPDDTLAALARAAAVIADIQSKDHDFSPGPFEIRLEEKQSQLREAIALAAGLQVKLAARAQYPASFVVPGTRVPLQLRIENHGTRTIEFPLNLRSRVAGLPRTLGANSLADIDFEYQVSDSAAVTRAPFHRDSPVTDAYYTIDDAAFAQYALPPPPIMVAAGWSIAGVVGSTTASAGLFVAPAISIKIFPSQVLLRRGAVLSQALQVSTQNNSGRVLQGSLQLSLPKEWKSQPGSVSVHLAPGATEQQVFTVQWPARLSASSAKIGAFAKAEGHTYTDSYELLARRDLPDAFPYYAPAQTTISLIDAEIPERHSIGYIMGAGDTLPDSLSSLGFDVHLLTEQDLAAGDLGKWDTIVTGVRAYGSRADLRAHNARLLDYVRNGGTMVVQYEQDIDGFNSGKYVPYPATMGKQRVSQEEQPVTMLDPEAQIFRYPNRITGADFDGWVQERGLYFMKEWSPDYTPLLSMNDAGEPPLQGGLLVARYGKGTYISTGLSFYRELPNGVAGAARLFINLLAAGHNPAEQPVSDAKR